MGDVGGEWSDGVPGPVIVGDEKLGMRMIISVIVNHRSNKTYDACKSPVWRPIVRKELKN